MDISFLHNRRALDKDYVSDMVGHPVKSFSLSAGAKKGDNIIGKMLALKAELEDEDNTELNLVIKSAYPLTGELDFQTIMQSQFLSNLEVFPVEIAFYNVIRPQLQQLSGFPCDNPRYLSGVSDGLNDYICLEDLRPKGYKMPDKFKGMTLEEVKAVLEKVALLHAHSYGAIKAAEQGKCERIAELLKLTNGVGSHIWTRPIEDLDQKEFFNAIVGKMGEVLRENGEVVSEKMERFRSTGHQIVIDLWKKTGIPEGGKCDKYFKVLIHGDLWINNVLLKYTTSGEVEDVVFIDYQQCRFGNVYEDLEYFIFTSTTAQFRKENLRLCLKHYFLEFAKILETLPEPVSLPIGFSEEELIATFYENIEYGFCYNLVGIPFQLGIAVDAPPSNNHDAHPPVSNSPPPHAPPQPPSATEMAMMHAEGLKQATKNSPLAVQRLKDMVNEMKKLNIL